jgi:hypothetical protein
MYRIKIEAAVNYCQLEFKNLTQKTRAFTLSLNVLSLQKF